MTEQLTKSPRKQNLLEGFYYNKRTGHIRMERADELKGNPDWTPCYDNGNAISIRQRHIEKSDIIL